MKRLSIASLLVIGFTGAQNAARADVVSVHIHGNSCFNVTPTVPVRYNTWGVYNNSTTTGATVHCPVIMDAKHYTSFWFGVTGWSRNNGVSKLSCNLTSTLDNGDGAAGSTATVPYDASNAKHASATTFPAPNTLPTPFLTCYIPPISGGWPSYISTILVRGFF